MKILVTDENVNGDGYDEVIKMSKETAYKDCRGASFDVSNDLMYVKECELNVDGHYFTHKSFDIIRPKKLTAYLARWELVGETKHGKITLTGWLDVPYPNLYSLATE